MMVFITKSFLLFLLIVYTFLLLSNNIIIFFFTRHWIAVFGHVVGRNALKLVDELKTKFQSLEGINDIILDQ